MTQIIAGRYAALAEPVRVGGLADVLACTDLQDGGQRVAVKLLRDMPDRNELLQEAFHREVKALRELRHPNIVLLRDAGTDDATGRYYLALEWVPYSLPSWTADHPVADASAFIDHIGFPILQALAFAHEREVIHRDVKPSNVLVTDEGVVKLADFGISKIKTALVESNHTLAQYSSVPFAPPERESKSSFSRDVFGFGVFLLVSLSAEAVEGYTDFPRALDSVEADLEVVDLIESCVSLEPADRPRSAPELLLKLDAIRQRRRAADRRVRSLSLDLVPSVKQRIIEQEEIPESSVKDLVLRELADSPSLRPLLSDKETPALFDSPWFGNERHFFIYGDEWSFRAVAREESPRLAVIGALRVGAIENESQRDRHLVLSNVRFVLEPPLNYATAREDIRSVIDAAFAYEGVRQGERKAQERARLFEQWNRQLDAREAADEEREQRCEVVFKSGDGYRLTLTLKGDAPQDLEGQERVVLDDRGRLIARGAVDTVEAGEVALYLLKLPVRPATTSRFLALDTGASRSKLYREREALARVRFGSSGLASAALPELLLEPGSAPEVTAAAIESWVQDNLDEHKRAAVEHAVASSYFTVVHGPPGTGKTTFVVELVAQEFRRSPTTRILLTSQTHVAVDNALEHIRRVCPEAKLLRVGTRAQEKIAAEVMDLAVEPQLERWREEVRTSATSYLEDLVRAYGVDVSAVRRSHRLTELAGVVRRMQLCQKGVERRIEQLRAGTSEEGALADDARADIEAEVEKLGDGLNLARRQATLLLQDPLLADVQAPLDVLDPSGLLGQANELLPDDTAAGVRLRQLVDAHAQWIERIGSGTEFEAALVVASQLVAGTCVGVAGSPGIDEEEFDLCIVDEASKATPTETLVPLVRAKRWVLVGDENQLPPFLDEALHNAGVQEEFALDPAELKQTLFGRLAHGLPASSSRFLICQYRMVPAIGDLISHCFYGDKLGSHPRAELPFTREVQGCAATWMSTAAQPDRRERRGAGTSFLNLCEAREIMRYLSLLAEHVTRAGLAAFHVLVLAPYAEQVRELDRRVGQERERLNGLLVEVNTVDAAQGREADALVFSCVRSNPQGHMGFVRELERTNVALSRGKFLLAIFGDSAFFDRAGGPLSDVLQYVRQHPSSCTIKEL